ncbi:HutD family protein [Sedimentibacter sp. MB31-C6]|uniref:HutD family protein n=1 Tax=Sedimentibacter sp. MB31-C6 TaxID=3109366 RepID=UPI002DDD7E05|nr:HutD family protein [Sedimentibacter sp. MB36-C1]WSI04348.1 HutD family protein [Sedimentibacter sp. MB36-C1]
MAYDIKIIKEKDFITSEWSGGKTTQMYIYPEESSYKELNFKWRISSATVDLKESDFTELAGVYRFITSLDNNLKLTHDYKKYIELKPFDIYEFCGDIRTHSFGQVKDFNLMLSNEAKGKLRNLNNKIEHILEFANEGKTKKFEIFYSYYKPLVFLINDEEILLNKNELLIIKLSSNTKINVKILTQKTVNILHASLME